MDESVLRAMARWPDVPDVFGWLALDRRGRWLLKGETIGNRAARAFIARNYDADEQGRWYFQNGPQRVFVDLEIAPWVLRLEPDGSFTTHTGLPAGEIREVHMDETGTLLLQTARGPGVLDDRDLDAFSEALVAGDGSPLDEEALAARLESAALAGGSPDVAVRLAGMLHPVRFLARDEAPGRLGFVRTPSEAAHDDERPPAG